jgi:hypothetical protein
LDNLKSATIVADNTPETQLRPLNKLLNDPDLQVKVWQEAVRESNESNEPMTAKKVEEVVQRYCEPCINPSIELRRVFYLTHYYDNLLDKAMNGEKESTFLRSMTENYLDNLFKNKKI